MVDSIDELKSLRSVAGKNFPNYEMLDARLASGLNKIIQNSYFKKKVSLEEQREDRFLRGRQIAFMIYDHCRATDAHDTVLDHTDLFSITHRNDDIQEFDTKWDEVLLSMSKIPSDDVLESLCKLRIRESAQLNTVLELCDMEIHHKVTMPNYQKLKTMVKRRTNKKIRLRNFDARFEKIETGAVVKSCRGLSDVERGKGICYQWKEKGSVRRETNVVSCMRVTIVQNRHQKPLHPVSHQTPRGRSASRKRNFRDRSQTGKFNRQPCKYFLKGTCTKLPCEYWHPPECQFYQTKSGCEFGRTALRQANIRENKGPSLKKKIQVKIPHQRSPCAMTFEDKET